MEGDSAEQSSEVHGATAQQIAEAFDQLTGVFQSVIDALRDLNERVATFVGVILLELQPVLELMRRFALERLTSQQVETAYQRYAARLNVRRRARKLSWHRLNRPRRARALDLYLVECWQP